MQCKFVEQSYRVCDVRMIVLSSEKREGVAGAEEKVKVDRNWEIGRHHRTEAG